MDSKVKTLDGGFSTQLSRYVGPMDGDPLWTARYVATNPDAVVRTHLDFLEAGSDFIETSTYQASVGGYRKHLNLSEEDALNLIKTAGELAIKAKGMYLEKNPGAEIEVVGSIGPFGALLNDGSEYTGNYTDDVPVDVIKESYRHRLIQLIKAGITTFALETIPSKKEALAAIELLDEFPDIKVWLSFSCKDEKSLVYGDDFKETALFCYKKNPKQIIAVGVNCLNPLYVRDLFGGINDGKTEEFIPLIVYPNSGEKYTSEAGWSGVVDIPPLHEFVKEWTSLGVRYVGGCCRIGADHIASIKREVDEINK